MKYFLTSLVLFLFVATLMQNITAAQNNDTKVRKLSMWKDWCHDKGYVFENKGYSWSSGDYGIASCRKQSHFLQEPKGFFVKIKYDEKKEVFDLRLIFHNFHNFAKTMELHDKRMAKHNLKKGIEKIGRYSSREYWCNSDWYIEVRQIKERRDEDFVAVIWILAPNHKNVSQTTLNKLSPLCKKELKENQNDR